MRNQATATVPDTSAAHDSNRLALVATPSAVGCARVFVEYALNRWGLRGSIEVTGDLACEIVASLLMSSDDATWQGMAQLDRLTLQLVLTRDHLLNQVWTPNEVDCLDSKPRIAQRRAMRFPLVRRRSDRWGAYQSLAGGTVVWYQIGLGDGPPAEPGRDLSTGPLPTSTEFRPRSAEPSTVPAVSTA